MYESLLIHDRGSIRTLTLNRPDRRNALTPELQSALIAACEDTAADPTIQLLILTGSGKAFCAGLDLSALQTMRGQSPAETAADTARIARMFHALYELPIPTIAAVNGHAMAGGAGLATLCDFTLAVPAASFAYTEARIGFVPALVSAYLVLQVGEKRARDLLLTARAVPAEEAHRLGIVTEVVPPEDLETRTQALAATLLANSPASLRATKQLLAEQNKPWLAHALTAAAQANAAIRQTPDFHEGISAFLEKRPPTWS